MPDRSTRAEWLSERTGLTLLALVSAVLATLILLPYLQYILLGVVLAYILMPAQRRLERTVGSMTAALTLVVVAILAILLPMLYVLAVALREALQVLAAVQDGSLGMDDLERRLEVIGQPDDLIELFETYQEPIGTAAQGLATSGIELVSGLPGLLIGLTVTVFVLFALLRDGDRLVAWIRHVLPIDDDIQRALLADLDQLMWASVVGNVVVAAIQAVALGIGLAVLGVPAVVLLTVATFVLALLPLIGAFGVWVPVSLYLLAAGDIVGAVALVVYGSVVSASDTYLRPALIGRTSALNSAIIVVGIFGGIVVFGAVGLFVGPVVLGGAKVTLDAFARERTAETSAEPGLEDGEETEDPAVDTAHETGIRTDVGEESNGGGDGAREAPVDAGDGSSDETGAESADVTSLESTDVAGSSGESGVDAEDDRPAETDNDSAAGTDTDR
ncbi:AI-2E family transporter [Natronorubrum sp. DTA7]|uniref:AI-2E family transporter n=1 Tax=Natronorubrum sp. DTA7 TaxID=3447016 RepID=UPI003F83F386